MTEHGTKSRGANLTKTQVKYVDIRNKTIYTMTNLTNHISSDYRDGRCSRNIPTKTEIDWTKYNWNGVDALGVQKACISSIMVAWDLTASMLAALDLSGHLDIAKFMDAMQDLSPRIQCLETWCVHFFDFLLPQLRLLPYLLLLLFQLLLPGLLVFVALNHLTHLQL